MAQIYGCKICENSKDFCVILVMSSKNNCNASNLLRAKIFLDTILDSMDGQLRQSSRLGAITMYDMHKIDFT